MTYAVDLGPRIGLVVLAWAAYRYETLEVMDPIGHIVPTRTSEKTTSRQQISIQCAHGRKSSPYPHTSYDIHLHRSRLKRRSLVDKIPRWSRTYQSKSLHRLTRSDIAGPLNTTLTGSFGVNPPLFAAMVAVPTSTTLFVCHRHDAVRPTGPVSCRARHTILYRWRTKPSYITTRRGLLQLIVWSRVEFFFSNKW